MINIQINGVRIHQKAGDTETEGLLLQHQLREKAQLSRSKRAARIPFDRAAQDYLTHIKATLSVRSHEMALTDYNKYLKPFFGLVLLNELDNKMLLKFQAHQKKQTFKGRKLANRTVNMHLGLVRKINNHAIQRALVPDNRLTYPMLREQKRVHAYFEPEEFARLTKHVSYDLALARIELGRYTGLRPKELAYLAWDDINLEAKTITVQAKPDAGFQIKTDEERVIPLNKEAVSLLKRLERSSRWVFAKGFKPVLNIRKAIKTAARLAGINRRVTPGMLRHTFATHLLQKGVDIETLRNLMGHKSIETTQKYLHSMKDSMKNAVELLT